MTVGRFDCPDVISGEDPAQQMIRIGLPERGQECRFPTFQLQGNDRGFFRTYKYTKGTGTMEEQKMTELVKEMDRLIRTVQEARAALTTAEQELETFLKVNFAGYRTNGKNKREQRTEGTFRKTRYGVRYDEQHGCLVDKDGNHLLTLD